MEKKIDLSLFKRLIAYFKPYKNELIVAVALTVFGSLFSLVPPLISKHIIDSYIVNTDISYDDRIFGVAYLIVIFILILIIDFTLRFVKGYVTGKIGQKAIRDIRIDVFKRLQELSSRYYDSNPIGKLMTRVTNDIEALNEMFTQGVVTIFGDIFMILGIIIILLVINLKLALWTFSVLPILFIVSFLFRLKVRTNLTLVRTLVGKLNSFVQENLTGMYVVKLFNREQKNFEQFKQINQEHTDAWVKNVNLYSIYFPTVEFVSSVAIGLIIWASSEQIRQGDVSFGTIVLYIQMAQMFFRPISDLSEKYNIIQSAMASSERIFEVLDTKSEIVQKKDAYKSSQFKGKIEFKNVWFSYKLDNIQESDYVLKNISFIVEAGEHVAFVGHTGAGKTTIISLINRSYDVQQGSIYIDDIDIRDYDLQNLRANYAMVLQDLYLFSGSVYDNISLFNDQITKIDIENACQMVYADAFIRLLPESYETKIKERGSILSTGQKQLLSFARALVRDSKVLILDEATSSIDTETEEFIQKALKVMMTNRTSLMIAHRLSTIKDANKIIVMHHGEIAEIGKHFDLLENDGLYNKLYTLQYKEQELNS